VLTVSAQSAGLVAAYGFNEGTGTTVVDASGNGTIETATWATLGKYGKALAFNGTSARVMVNDSASLHLATGMPLEVWVMPTASQTSWRTIIQKEVDTYFLTASSNSARRPAATGATFGSTVTTIAGPSAIPVSSWTPPGIDL
jgi:hypothetical protein